MTQPNKEVQPIRSDAQTLARGAGITLPGRLTGRALAFLAQVILARFLGPEAFGLYAIGWTILRLGELVAPLGLHQGVIRFGSGYLDRDQSALKGVLVHSFILATLSGLLIGVGLYASAPWLAHHVFHKPELVPVFRWFAPGIALAASLQVAAAATRLSQRMQFSVVAQELVQPGSNLMFVVIAFLAGWGLLGAVAAGVASFAIALAFALRYAKRLFPEAFSPRVRASIVGRRFFKFSLATSLATMFTSLIFWVDRLIVGHFLPASEVGVYQASSQSAMLFAIILSAFNLIFSPMIAQLYHQGAMDRLAELYRVSTKWGLYICLPLFLVVAFSSREVMVVVFGYSYQDGALPLLVMSIGQLVNAGTGAVGVLLVMTGHQNRWVALSGGMLLANVSLTWLLTPGMGLLGAAIGNATAVIGLSVLGLLQVKRSLGLWPYDRRYYKGIAAGAASAGVLFLLSQLRVHPPVLELLMAVIVAGSIFGVTLLLLGFDPEDREIVRIVNLRLK